MLRAAEDRRRDVPLLRRKLVRRQPVGDLLPPAQARKNPAHDLRSARRLRLGSVESIRRRRQTSPHRIGRILPHRDLARAGPCRLSAAPCRRERAAPEMWEQQAERGTPLAITALLCIPRTLGRPGARPVLYPVTNNFPMTGSAALRASRHLPSPVLLGPPCWHAVLRPLLPFPAVPAQHI